MFATDLCRIRRSAPVWYRVTLLTAVLAALPIREAPAQPSQPKQALPEFAWREFSVAVTSNGKPVGGALIYGFCRELNLIWPRSESEVLDEEDLDRPQSVLRKTGADGKLKVIVPPGKWGFFAVRAAEGNTPAIAAWSDFQERAAGDTVALTASKTKRWSPTLSDDTALAADRLLLKPRGFPIWSPIGLGSALATVTVAISDGKLELWASGNAARNPPAFIVDCGTVSTDTADGNLPVPQEPVTFDLTGVRGRSTVTWNHRASCGLEGTLVVSENTRLYISPGTYLLAYRRPIGAQLAADFVAQAYTLESGQNRVLDFDTPLAAGVDQQFSKADKKGNPAKLDGRLYLVDGNGHVMSELLDANSRPVTISAAVELGGKRFEARNVWGLNRVRVKSEAGQTMFEADLPEATSAADAVWDFKAPPGILPQTRLTEGDNVAVASTSFQMKVPTVLKPAAQNVLTQAEALAAAMTESSGRKRRRENTTISIKPGRGGAAALHDGTWLGIGTKLFFSDSPMLRHDFVHELAHNFNFNHGGLMETVVETSRCAGGDQISHQAGKWLFFDRMNGLTRKEAPYQNVGLYLYCYAQGGPKFLRFMAATEPAARKKLDKLSFSEGEITAALLSVALDRDMTSICRQYGFGVTQDRTALAVRALREMQHAPGSVTPDQNE